MAPLRRATGPVASTADPRADLLARDTTALGEHLRITEPEPRGPPQHLAAAVGLLNRLSPPDHQRPRLRLPLLPNLLLLLNLLHTLKAHLLSRSGSLR